MTLLRCRTLTPAVAALLSTAMWPDPARIQAALARYGADPALGVWCWQAEGRVVCAAGLRVSGPSAELLHIGTAADARHRGYGRSLLLALLERLQLSRIEAETDAQAAAFYRRVGFTALQIAGVGGQIRFRCILQH